MFGAKRVMAFPKRHVKRAKRTDHVKLLRLQRTVNALRPEVKYFNAATTQSPSTAAATVLYLSQIAQGTDNINRVADKIRSVFVEIIVSANYVMPTPPVAGNSTMFYLVQDLESSGVAPVAASTVQAIFLLPDPQRAIQNPDTRERFKILGSYDFSETRTQNGTTPNVWRKKFKMAKAITYHDTTSGVASAGKNSLFLIGMSNLAIGVGSFQVAWTVAFTDV